MEVCLRKPVYKASHAQENPPIIMVGTLSATTKKESRPPTTCSVGLQTVHNSCKKGRIQPCGYGFSWNLVNVAPQAVLGEPRGI